MRARTVRPGDPWSAPGEWVRGNIHCHSTTSDGRLPPQEVVRRYAQRGDGFLAISDHDRIAEVTGLDALGMCLVPASEVSAPGGELGTSYHLLAVGLRELPPPRTPAGEAAPFLTAQGAAVFVAHPHWSGLTVADIRRLPGVHGVEVHNGATVLDSCKGEALAHWDELLERGCRLWGIGADDMHWGTLDLGLSWAWVRVEAPEPQAIVAALKQGLFYSSIGPQILDVRVSDVEVRVRCSPCLAVYCLSFGPRNLIEFDRRAIETANAPRPICEAGFRLSGRERYARIQVVDEHRRSAWSNPLPLPWSA